MSALDTKLMEKFDQLEQLLSLNDIQQLELDIIESLETHMNNNEKEINIKYFCKGIMINNKTINTSCISLMSEFHEYDEFDIKFISDSGIIKQLFQFLKCDNISNKYDLRKENILRILDIITWETSFEQIGVTVESAADIISILFEFVSSVYSEYKQLSLNILGNFAASNHKNVNFLLNKGFLDKLDEICNPRNYIEVLAAVSFAMSQIVNEDHFITGVLDAKYVPQISKIINKLFMCKDDTLLSNNLESYSSLINTYNIDELHLMEPNIDIKLLQKDIEEKVNDDACLIDGWIKEIQKQNLITFSIPFVINKMILKYYCIFYGNSKQKISEIDFNPCSNFVRLLKHSDECVSNAAGDLLCLIFLYDSEDGKVIEKMFQYDLTKNAKHFILNSTVNHHTAKVLLMSRIINMGNKKQIEIIGDLNLFISCLSNMIVAECEDILIYSQTEITDTIDKLLDFNVDSKERFQGILINSLQKLKSNKEIIENELKIQFVNQLITTYI